MYFVFHPEQRMNQSLSSFALLSFLIASPFILILPLCSWTRCLDALEAILMFLLLFTVQTKCWKMASSSWGLVNLQTLMYINLSDSRAYVISPIETSSISVSVILV